MLSSINFLRSLAAGIVCGLLLAPSLSAVAQTTVLLPAAADTTIFSESNDLSNGAGDYFFSGRVNGPEIRRALIRFDLSSSIPAGSQITSVRLTLRMSKSKPGTDPVALHMVTADWGEGASDADAEEGAGAAAEANDATWAYRYYNTVSPGSSPAWAALGGDYDPVFSASIAVAGADAFYTWGSTSLMVDDAQHWLDYPAMNFGWVLIGNQASPRTAARFNSRTNPTVNQRPVLEVTFIPPAASGACCFADGSCLVLTPGGCAAQSGAYQGDGTSCSPNPCPQPFGACCFADGSCLNLTQMDCEAAMGFFQGNGTDCSTSSCPVLVGACCFNDGTCEELTESECLAQGGSFLGAGTDCSDADCPVILEKYVDALPIPPAAQPIGTTPEGYPLYHLDIVQTTHNTHRDLPPTTVWTYNGSWPGPSFVVQSGQPIAVEYFNDLRDEMGNPRTDHILPIDLCAHGAEDLPKVVTHLHGGHVPADVDGYPEDTFLPGSGVTYVYPNNQRAGLSWYHDHALGITRLNVLMGMAGGYIIRDSQEAALGLPSGEYEVPLVIQDRTFNADGSFNYPAEWVEHFFGDTFCVNGKAWPFHEVKQGVYRFRVINGCSSRTLTLSFGDPAITFDLIGVEGGLLAAPATLTQVTLSPAERADIIIDFSALAPGAEVILHNSAAAPYPNGDPMHALPDIMKFVVVGQPGAAFITPPSLSAIAPLDPSHAMASRDFTLAKTQDPCAGSIWLINGMHWDHISERPRLNSIETWRFLNSSGVTHPMHMHLVFFQVLGRNEYLGQDQNMQPIIGAPLPLRPTEGGWKDTVQVGPGEAVTVIARFEDYLGLYPYHCHILEHEDHEMMRQFEVVPACLGDSNGDGLVDFNDINTTIANWLNDYTPGTGPGDANADGVVGFDDITETIANWLGPCP